MLQLRFAPSDRQCHTACINYLRQVLLTRCTVLLMSTVSICLSFWIRASQIKHGAKGMLILDGVCVQHDGGDLVSQAAQPADSFRAGQRFLHLRAARYEFTQPQPFELAADLGQHCTPSSEFLDHWRRMVPQLPAYPNTLLPMSELCSRGCSVSTTRSSK